MAVQKGRSSLASETRTLHVGDPAPDFTLRTHAGKTFTLAEQRGKNVVLAFYPFAFSPTCSSQLPGLQANLNRFEEAGAEVAGISIDHTYANAAWAESLGGFSFPLLSDFNPHGAVASAYGVMRDDGMAERAVFIIDKQGIVRYIDVHLIKEEPDEEQILDELRKLG
jgi:peroxiredoxin